MHLRSVTMKGFKSFPDRTRLDFSPGVAVVVGPNGSGKSNITDAVLWALGEQSPLAVRGQQMQDVIFAGGHGLPSRSSAEVELVIDNSDGAIDSPFSELSIVRKLSRDGEGEYRLNGARCRLVDVIEALSDTGLGKEMHSVVSQGRVESIIHSKPRDRRLLIEEAAGLGKHRKRRRRAQLKLERTEENLSRALDVEREARSRLRPLKRQAEAAEVHERLERQSLEARMELARDRARTTAAGLAESEAAAAAARLARDQAERDLAQVAARREAAENAFRAHSREREALSSAAFAARSAADRISLRLERATEVAREAAESGERRRSELEAAESPTPDARRPTPEAADPIAALEREVARLDGEARARADTEAEELKADLALAAGRRDELRQATERCTAELQSAHTAAEQARRELREGERAVEAARSGAAAAGAELARVNGYLRAAAAAPAGARALAEDIVVESGYEAALAAALGSRLRAGVVADVGAGERLLDSAGEAGATALVAQGVEPAAPSDPPAPGAELLLERITPGGEAARIASRLLADAWVVDRLEAVREGFPGIAVTRAGRAFFGATGELRQAHQGGEERLLEERGRRDELVRASEEAAGAEAAARATAERGAEAVTRADEARHAAEGAHRAAVRAADEGAEAVRRIELSIERRRARPDEGPAAIRRAELHAELAAERRIAERAESERRARSARLEGLREGMRRDSELAASAAVAVVALERATAVVSARRDALAIQLEADQERTEGVAAELRACGHREAELQGGLRDRSQAVTDAEVAAQRLRDSDAEARHELDEVAERLGFAPEPATVALSGEGREELEARLARLARRREQLGPVNPLAKREYEEAIGHVEELEVQRTDLESALGELRGLIKETDKRIRESFEQTFEQAAKNFEDLVGHLFPDGRGRLRLVQPDGGPRPVLGGEEADEAKEEAAEHEETPGQDEPGVEVEVTPAGKSSKRLSLLSGGEKSLVALAFMFAVFLAKPCPFYILDEVEAALDDLNIDRFLQLVRRYSDRAQFIVVTHQKRTMDAADCLYGVSMGQNGVSKVVSRKLGGGGAALEAVDGAGEAAA